MTDKAMAKRNRTNNGLQNPTQKPKDWATRTQQTGGLGQGRFILKTLELVFSASRNTQH